MVNVNCWHNLAFDVGRDNTALIVIDMQRDFLDEQGACARAGVDVSRLAAIVPTVRRLLGAARDAGLTVVHTREGHRSDLSDLTPTKRAQYAASGIEIGALGPLGRHFVRGEYGHDIVDPLAPLSGEAVIDKPGFGAFHATDLEEQLRRKGIERLIFTGVTTQCCVHSSLREAVDRGFACLTVADATATEDPRLQDAVMAIIASEGHLFGAIASADDVIAALAPTP